MNIRKTNWQDVFVLINLHLLHLLVQRRLELIDIQSTLLSSSLFTVFIASRIDRLMRICSKLRWTRADASVVVAERDDDAERWLLHLFVQIMNNTYIHTYFGQRQASANIYVYRMIKVCSVSLSIDNYTLVVIVTGCSLSSLPSRWHLHNSEYCSKRIFYYAVDNR
jgi:hypothetical protein